MRKKFGFKNIYGTRNYFVGEIEQNEWMSKKYKKACTTLNYYFLILASTITGCIFISASASLAVIHIVFTIFTTRVKFVQ